MKPLLPLYDYQKNWLTDKSRFKIGMFARQTGKTFITTLEIVLACLQAEIEGKATKWLIISRSLRQAKEAMQDVYQHVQVMDTFYKAYQWHIPTGEKNIMEWQLPHGSRVIALPANADTIRGYSSNVLLDEFAFHQDLASIWSAVFPIISSGKRMLIVSTPNGTNNYFYEIMTNKQNLWSRHIVDIYQAKQGGLPRDIKEMKKAVLDSYVWQQEYELKWQQEGESWIAKELIKLVQDPLAGVPTAYEGNECFIGVDIARRNDFFVIVVLEKCQGVLWCREIIAMQNTSFQEQADLLSNCIYKYNVVSVCMDQTGMGEMPVEEAKKKHGNMIQGILMTQKKKYDLAVIGKMHFEQETSKLPCDRILEEDIQSIRRKVALNGEVQLYTERTKQGHGDRAWALLLATQAASGREEITYNYYTVDSGSLFNQNKFM